MWRADHFLRVLLDGFGSTVNSYAVHTWHPHGPWQASRVTAPNPAEAERAATADRARADRVPQDTITALVLPHPTTPTG